MSKKPILEPEIEVHQSRPINAEIQSALEGLKSYSPGEIYEYLQSKFPIQPIKSKAHLKTAQSLITILQEVIESADLDRAEANQIKHFSNTLDLFVEDYQKAALAEASPPPLKAKRSGLADRILGRLKDSVEAEKKNFFSSAKKKRSGDDEEQIVEASFKKIKRR